MSEEITDVPQQGPLDEGGESEREFVQHEGWYDLAWSFGTAGALTLFAYFFPAVFTIPLFGAYLAEEWLWYFTPSLSYVGQGIIMGFPTTVSMNLGMFVGWAVLSPLSKLAGWAPGRVGDMSDGARGWILWVALGIMCTDSLVSLVPVVWEFLEDAMRPLRRSYARIDGDRPAKRDHEDETPDRLVPMSWVLVGLSFSIVVGTVLVWLVFGHEGIKPWATVIGFFLGGLLSVIGYVFLSRQPISGGCSSNSQRSSLGRDRPEPGIGTRQDLAASFCMAPAGQHRCQHHCGRCGGSRRPTVRSIPFFPSLR